MSSIIGSQRRVTESPAVVLAVLSAAQLMVVLDFSIVNVALPSIQRELHFSAVGLQWVLSGYALTFGGLLLLGGRLADIVGRRRVLLSGLSLFVAASLCGGFAPTSGALVACRAVQGIAAAELSPAALSLLTTHFAEGSQRNRALGVFGAVSAGGFAIGVLLGGLLVSSAGWRAVMFINVPIGLAVWSAARLCMSESRVPGSRQLDLPGAFTATLGLVAIIFGLTRASSAGWSSLETIVPIAAGLGLLFGFVIIELAVSEPLFPVRLFALRTVVGGNLAMALFGMAVAPLTLLVTLYLQDVQHKSALVTGLSFVPHGVAVLLASQIMGWLVSRVGPKWVLLLGAALTSVAGVLLTQLPARGSYWVDLFPPLVIAGFGIAAMVVAATAAGTSGVPDERQGAASAMVNMMLQVGNAFGLAVVVLLASDRARHLGGGTRAELGGEHLGFWVIAGIGAVSLAAIFTVLPRRPAPLASA